MQDLSALDPQQSPSSSQYKKWRISRIPQPADTALHTTPAHCALQRGHRLHIVGEFHGTRYGAAEDARISAYTRSCSTPGDCWAGMHTVRTAIYLLGLAHIALAKFTAALTLRFRTGSTATEDVCRQRDEGAARHHTI